VRSATDTVGNLIARLSRDYGSTLAVGDVRGSVTFDELNRQSAELAAGLLAAGMAKGAKVGILMPNDRDFVVALFAITRIGGVAVLLSTLARGPELAHMIRHGDLDMLLCVDHYLSSDYVALLEAGLPSLARARPSPRLVLSEAPFLRSIWVWGTARPAWSSGTPDTLLQGAQSVGISPATVQAAEKEVVAADPAVIIYTSGSTAEPKAAVHSQGTMIRQSQTMGNISTYGPGDRLLSTLPFFWVGGLCTAMLAAFSKGAGIVCPEGPSTESTLEALRRWNPTQIMNWPVNLEKLMDRPEFIEAMKKMRPVGAPNLYMFGLASRELTPNSLGMTESFGPHSGEPPVPLPENRAGSFGRATGATERKIVDPETGKELPPNNFGMLMLRGGSMMMGLHRLEREDVFDADGFYRSDDICSISEDGYLFFAGRMNDMIKIGGANVSPPEVENVIRKIPGVKSVTVLGASGADKRETLAAAIIRTQGSTLNEDEVRTLLKPQLSSYKIPRHVIFLEDHEIPMTASAKIYKPGLRKVLEDKLAGKA
jgi:acyl-CoA synthetase (AMP-forming)/AMP-acid ligase II